MTKAKDCFVVPPRNDVGPLNVAEVAMTQNLLPMTIKNLLGHYRNSAFRSLVSKHMFRCLIRDISNLLNILNIQP